MLSRLLSGARYLIVLAALSIVLGATALLIYGTFMTGQIVGGVIQDLSGGYATGKRAKELLLACIEVVDLFLLATVLYVIAVGLYELFVDPSVAVPPWLLISDLDDLKEKLIGVVIAVLAVLFLGQVVTWDGQRNLLGVGAASALMIAALSYFFSQRPRKGKPPGAAEPPGE